MAIIAFSAFEVEAFLTDKLTRDYGNLPAPVKWFMRPLGSRKIPQSFSSCGRVYNSLEYRFSEIGESYEVARRSVYRVWPHPTLKGMNRRALLCIRTLKK